MDKEQIKQILPHREPMLLLDSANALNGEAQGRVSIKGGEWFLQGHFPGNPVVPGVMLCEMMAQTCCVLIGEKAAGATPYFTGMDKVRFRRPVRPGDTLELRCRLTGVKEPFYFAEGTGTVEGQLAVSVSFSFALITPKAGGGPEEPQRG